MQNSLFHEFDEITEKQWKLTTQYELGGKDYNEHLITRTDEDINIKPIYQPSNSTDSISIQTHRWGIAEHIYVSRERTARKNMLKALQCGSESLYLTLPTMEVDLEKLFFEVPLNGLTLYLKLEFLQSDFVDQLITFFRDKNTSLHLQLDIIGKLAKSGNWYVNTESDIRVFTEIQQQLQTVDFVESSISIDASLYQNAGANMVQQLAYTLAHANEYFNRFDQYPMAYCIYNSVGSHYFFEMAKLRAFRVLWESLSEAYSQKPKLHILSIPSKRNKTLYDYNVNMLRTTTEYMSAVLGGSDSVAFLPYDTIYHKDNTFAKRIARNQLLILKHESYFDTVSNPADGTYYVEEVCREMCEKALKLFKQIESGGGFLAQLIDHQIQKKIKESAQKELLKFQEGVKILIGTNKYQNPQDHMANELERYPFVKTNTRKTLIEPIIERRLSEKNEQERLKTEAK